MRSRTIGAGKIRFVMDEQASVYDDIGTTAMDGVRKTVKDAENERTDGAMEGSGRR